MSKNWLIAILIAVCTILVLNTFFGWFKTSDDKKVLDEFLTGKTDTVFIEKWIDKDSVSHVKFEPNKGHIIDNKVSQHYMSYVRDTLAPALKIANEKISELTRINANLSGELKVKKYQLDDQNFKRAYYENKYLSIVTDEKDSTVKYSYNAKLDIVNYSEKKGLFGKRKDYVDISSPDKNFKINGVEHFKKEILIAPNKFGVGVQVGYHYNPHTNSFSPSIGLGLSYNFIRF